jgi:histone H3/H4
MNMQDLADKCTKKFLEKAEEKMEDTSKIPSNAITRYCRMLIIYCDTEGKVSESFISSMDKCIQEIISVEGMEEIMNECNECPENI